jgi:hypothetical protein
MYQIRKNEKQRYRKIYTGYTQMNGVVSKVNKNYISHLTRAQHTLSVVTTVQVSHVLITNPSIYSPWFTQHTSTR